MSFSSDQTLDRRWPATRYGSCDARGHWQTPWRPIAMAVTACLLAAGSVYAQNIRRPPTWVGAVPPASQIQYAGGLGGVFQIISQANGLEFVGPASQARGTLGYARNVGLQMSISSNWPGQYGYRPIKLKFTSRRAATADKKIQVRFFAGPWYNRLRAMTVDQELTLETGDISATATLLAPQYVDWQSCGWEVRVDGTLIDELSHEQTQVMQQGGSGGVAALVTPPSLVDAGLPTLLQPLTGGVGQVQSVKLADLPTDWLQYTTIDLVIMPASELPRLVSDHPKRSAALLRWVRAGGNLWLLRAGDDWWRLAPVDAVLGATDSKLSGDAGWTDATMGAAAWRYLPMGERAVQPVEAALAISRFDVTPGAPRSAGKPLASRADPMAEAVPAAATVSVGAARSIKARPHGLGVVAAFARDLPAPGNGVESPVMEAVRQSLLGARISGSGRMGNVPVGSNADFNNWLIPDVGVAPVGQFQFLISLFVIGIGPLNYWWLKRRKNLPLLLVTAPLAASLVTLSLLSYGMLADGIGVRARARSLTLLDQRAGEATSWSRLSYYAGVAPDAGLTMPKDVALYPVLPAWADSYNRGRNGGGNDRVLRWTDKQMLTRGWLTSRTPTQYLAIAARPTAKRLELRVGDKGLRIVNRLGVGVLQVAVQDHEGKQYWCENLPDGEGRVVPAVERKVIATAMRRTFSDNFPTFPPGAEESWYGNYYGNKLSQNLMESRLEAINSPMVEGWGDGSYMAITDRGAEVDLGLENVREEQSFHVIEGSW